MAATYLSTMPAVNVRTCVSNRPLAQKYAFKGLPMRPMKVRNVFPRRTGATTTRAVATEGETENDLADAGLAAMRVATGVLMIHNGLDKLVDPAGFAEFVVKPFLGLPFPLAATYVAAYVELLCSTTLIIGLFTRYSALALFGTMGAAVVFHLKASGLEGFPFGAHIFTLCALVYAFEAAALYAGIYLCLVATGGGKYSVDALIDSEE